MVLVLFLFLVIVRVGVGIRGASVPDSLGVDLPHQIGDGTLPQHEVQEPRPGDLDALDPVRHLQPAREHRRHLTGCAAGRPGHLERDGRGVLPTPPGRVRSTTTRSGTTASTGSSPSSTAQRTARTTVRERSAGVTSPSLGEKPPGHAKGFGM